MPAPGMMSTLMFGICISLGQFTPKQELWKTVRTHLPTQIIARACAQEDKGCLDIDLALCDLKKGSIAVLVMSCLGKSGKNA